MSARIRHLALYTENQQGMASFYKNVASMAEVPVGVPMERIVDWTLVKEISAARSK